MRPDAAVSPTAGPPAGFTTDAIPGGLRPGRTCHKTTAWIPAGFCAAVVPQPGLKSVDEPHESLCGLSARLIVGHAADAEAVHALDGVVGDVYELGLAVRVQAKAGLISQVQ